MSKLTEFAVTANQVAGLVQLGVASLQAIVSAVHAGKLAVHDAGGQALTADDVAAHVAAAQAEALAAGDEAAGRVEGRHQGDMPLG